MKRQLSMCGIAAIGIGCVVAPALAADAAPLMSFLASPGIAQSGEEHGTQVTWSRHADTIVAVVKSASACGQRAADPSVRNLNGTLELGFEIAGAPDSTPACVATTIFTLKDLPASTLRVAASVREAPVAAAATEARPEFTFMSVPAADAGSLGNSWTYQRWVQDSLLVIARDPSDCGQRHADPSVQLRGGTLSISYGLPLSQPEGATGNCAATAIVSVKNLPRRDYVVETNPRYAPAAEAAGPESAVTMSFMGVPAFSSADSYLPQVSHHKDQDKAVVIVRDRAACGDRPAEPSFSYHQATVELRYTLPENDAATATEAQCASVAIFSFRNLPEGHLRVSALAQRGSARSLSLGVEAPAMAAEAESVLEAAAHD
jgi:hypothetical protein